MARRFLWIGFFLFSGGVLVANPFVLRSILLVCALIGAVALAPAAYAGDTVSDFKQNCSGCHTIGGGPRTGPDLKDVEARQARDWLVRFIVDPNGVIDSGDAYAQKLLTTARGVRMPPIAGMSKKRAEVLLDLIATESKLEKSQFKGIDIPMRPFTPEDIALGADYFTGRKSLAAGGPACLACHAIGGVGAFGGGTLGPDLTKVYERYEDRKKLGAWLGAPATPTMAPTFRAHPFETDEILALVAYFEDAAKNEQESDSNAALLFLLLGVGGAAVLLVLFDRIWARRFRAVRAPLIRRASWAGRAATSDEGTNR